MKKIYVFCLLVVFPLLTQASAGFFNTPSIFVNNPSGNTYCQGTSLIIGGQANTYQHDCDYINSVQLFYQIDGGAWSNIYLNFISESSNDGAIGKNKKWETNPSAIDILAGLAVGSHTIKWYFDATGTDRGACPDSGGNTGNTFHVFDSNGGANYTGNFTINAKPTASISYPTIVCSQTNAVVTPTLTGTSGGTYSSTAPLSINASTGAITLSATSSDAGTYTVTYNFSSNGCSSSTTASITIPNCSSFPVKLLSFDGQQIENHNFLSWATAEMVDFNRFEIEKSSNAISFEKIYSLKMDKNYNEKQTFSYADISPLDGQNYYRLKMIDNNGTITYSKIIAVDFLLDGEYMTITNPFKNNEIFIKTNLENPIFKLFDVNGKEVLYKSTPLEKAYQLIPSSVTSVLYLKTMGKNRSFSARLLAQ